MTGNPVAFHAMRGLAAHSNGFQTIRSLSILMSLLGTIDRPGGFRHKAPYPRGTPPIYARNPTSLEAIHPDMPLGGAPLGFPAGPDDLFVDDEGRPVRIDKAFSWEYPLAIHGMMHNVIANAWRGDPYRIDTLMIFMANMAWNSSMNPVETRRMLNDRDENGEFRIPFVIVCDAFQSEMTAFADLVLPDTTYLERHDVMSLLDRPISEFDGPADSVRVPVVPPTGECKPFQDVLVELAGRLRFPAFVNPDGSRKFRDYADFIVNFETEPGSGQGFLIGWRGKDGDKALVGEPNPRQWEMYAKNNCVYHYRMPPNYPVHAQLEPGLPRVGAAHEAAAPVRSDHDPDLRGGAAAIPPRRAGQMAVARGVRPQHLKERIATYFDPLPFHYAPLEVQATRHGALSARGDHAAADGHVPLVGFAERVAAPDPRAQLPVRQSARRARAGHRGRRLDLGRIDARAGALHVPLQRGGRAGHGLDLERDRQGARRVGPGAGCQRGARGLPPESPHLRRAAAGGNGGRGCRIPIPSPARPAGTTCACASPRRCRGRAEGDLAPVRLRPRRCRARPAERPSWLAYRTRRGKDDARSRRSI